MDLGRQKYRPFCVRKNFSKLLEKGIALTTMDDISKEAGYSKSTVYVYFKSKDEIYNVGVEINGFIEDFLAVCVAAKQMRKNILREFTYI